jgi:hypothetical protein
MGSFCLMPGIELTPRQARFSGQMTAALLSLPD